MEDTRPPLVQRIVPNGETSLCFYRGNEVTVSVSTMTYCIYQKTAKSSLSGFLSICQAEAFCIFPAACLAARLPLC